MLAGQGVTPLDSSMRPNRSDVVDAKIDEIHWRDEDLARYHLSLSDTGSSISMG